MEGSVKLNNNNVILLLKIFQIYNTPYRTFLFYLHPNGDCLCSIKENQPTQTTFAITGTLSGPFGPLGEWEGGNEIERD